MSVKIYWIQHNIGTMARPRGHEWLEDEIISLKKQRVQVVVSLLETPEIAELGLRQEQVLCEKHGISCLHFPIPDRGLPAKGMQTNTFIRSLADKAVAGQIIAVHCRMGIGRASIIAGSILVLAGHRPNDVISTITKARGLYVPDTPEQIQWLQNIK